MSVTKTPLKQRTLRLYQHIREEYAKLSSLEEFGRQKHSTEWIIAKLAHDFYKSEKTIENIIFNRV